MPGNLELWESVEKTDPSRVKAFQGKGGFRGTAINAMYLIKRATEQWGPMGGRWGVRIITHEVSPGAPLLNKEGNVVGHEQLHIVLAEIYYPGSGDGRCTLPCFGQTILAGRRSNGDFFTDEDAPKKSLTDALTKGLSWLGFSADVHEGRWDDAKYVADLKKEFAEKENGDGSIDKKRLANRLKDAAATGGLVGLQEVWSSLTVEERKAVQGVKDKIKEGFTSATAS